MNLLELQVLAVVSRIPDGSDAPSPDFDYEPVTRHPRAQREPGDTTPPSQSNANLRPTSRS